MTRNDSRTYDPTTPPARLTRLGSGVVMRRDHQTLTFLSRWADGEEVLAATATVPEQPALRGTPAAPGVLQAELELGDGLCATVTRHADRYVWALMAVWEDDQRKELYRIESTEPPYAWIQYTARASVSFLAKPGYPQPVDKLLTTRPEQAPYQS